LWESEVLVCRVHRRINTKVYADAVAHELLAIKRFPYLYRRLDVKEGYYDAAEGLEWCPGVYFGMLIYRLADFGEGVELEDFGGEKVLDRVSLTANYMFRIGGFAYRDDERV
jgi:hypothetical protein